MFEVRRGARRRQMRRVDALGSQPTTHLLYWLLAPAELQELQFTRSILRVPSDSLGQDYGAPTLLLHPLICFLDLACRSLPR